MTSARSMAAAAPAALTGAPQQAPMRRRLSTIAAEHDSRRHSIAWQHGRGGVGAELQKQPRAPKPKSFTDNGGAISLDALAPLPGASQPAYMPVEQQPVEAQRCRVDCHSTITRDSSLGSRRPHPAAPTHSPTPLRPPQQSLQLALMPPLPEFSEPWPPPAPPLVPLPLKWRAPQQPSQPPSSPPPPQPPEHILELQQLDEVERLYPRHEHYQDDALYGYEPPPRRVVERAAVEPLPVLPQLREPSWAPSSCTTHEASWAPSSCVTPHAQLAPDCYNFVANAEAPDYGGAAGGDAVWAGPPAALPDELEAVWRQATELLTAFGPAAPVPPCLVLVLTCPWRTP